MQSNDERWLKEQASRCRQLANRLAVVQGFSGTLQQERAAIVSELLAVAVTIESEAKKLS